MAEKLHIIWDLDGTLIDSEQEFLDALTRAVKSVNMPAGGQIAPFRVGPTIDKIVDSAFKSEILTEQKKTEIIAAFRREYDNCGFNNTHPFVGIENILNDKRFINHIVTNKPDLATGRILDKLGWNDCFLSVTTPYSYMKSPDGQKKTKAQLFQICMRPYNRASFVGIGDMKGDALAAKETGIPAFGVLWGSGTKEELEICDKLFSTVQELQTYLHEIKAT